MRGTPQTVSALTTASTDDVLAVLYVEADLANTGEVMRRMLKQFALPAVLLYDVATLRIIGTTHSATRTALVNAFNAPLGNLSVFTPNEPQVKTTWSSSQDDNGLYGQLANAYQKRSFDQLVNTGLSLAWNLHGSEPCVLVNQLTGEVSFKYATLNLSAITPAAQTVCVVLTQGKPKLAFE